MTLTLTPTEAASLPCDVMREMEKQPPVCPECGNTGVVDSGAPDEQGKFIDLPCWCESCTKITRFFAIPRRLLPEQPEKLVPTHIQDAYASVKWQGSPWSGHEVLASDRVFVPPCKPGDRIGSATVQSVEPVKVDSKWWWKIRVKGE